MPKSPISLCTVYKATSPLLLCIKDSSVKLKKFLKSFQMPNTLSTTALQSVIRILKIASLTSACWKLYSLAQEAQIN